MEQTINRIIECINNSKGSIVIGVSGNGAAGKATFTELLCRELNKNDYNLLNTDAYIIPSKYRKFTSASYTYEGVNHTYKVTACCP